MTALPKNMTRAPRASTRWRTTSIAPRFLVALLDEAGRPVDDLLAANGIARSALVSADFAMPLDGFRDLWARAAAVQPDIGLALAERFPPGQMHLLVHLALRSPTVRQALEDVCRYAGVSSPGERFELHVDATRATLRYHCIVPGLHNPWMAEHMLGMTVLCVAAWSGQALPLHAVRFASPALAPAAVYRQRFGLDPQFAAAHTELEFAVAALEWPLQTSDPYLHAILERVAAARAAPADDLLDTVRQLLAQSLLRGQVPTLDGVAAASRLSPRALRERLAQRATTFRALLDDVRRDLASDHLGRGMSVNEAAYLLGFSEPAAFQRACRRWFAVSAGAARRQLVAHRAD